MANKTVGNGVGPVHSRNNVNHQNQFVPQAVLLDWQSKTYLLLEHNHSYWEAKGLYHSYWKILIQNACRCKGIFDSGCSRSMTAIMETLDDFSEFQG
ncbi:hypothetical protein Tco_0128929 [Tanacetum coccineum]